MKKYLLCVIGIMISGVALAQECLQVSYSFEGYGENKSMQIVLKNLSGELMRIRNDDGTGSGSLLQFIFLDANGKETAVSECNFVAPYSEVERFVKIDPYSLASFKYNLGALREQRKKQEQLGVSVTINCFVHYTTASQTQLRAPYHECFNLLLTQTEMEHFIYVPERGGGVSINPKGKVNSVLQKGEVILDFGDYKYKKGNIPWYSDAEIKPFQKLIDKGVFSKQRMKELAAGKEPIHISLYFDETGIIKYVHFWLSDGEKTLLTDEELYAIYQAYDGLQYDLSHAKVERSENVSKTVFYCSAFFEIPFEDLKY